MAFYGPDGVGKSKQIELLEERLRQMGVMLRKVRYPVYDLHPSGPRLDLILHHHKGQLPEEEMQKLFVQNRKDFEPTLVSWLNSGVMVIAENYKGTGIVWGTVRGIPTEKMEEMNKDNLEPDVAILLDGPNRELTFDKAHPYVGHEINDEEWYRVRKTYLAMADKYGWIRVSADAPTLTVASRIWAVLKPVVAK